MILYCEKLLLVKLNASKGFSLLILLVNSLSSSSNSVDSNEENINLLSNIINNIKIYEYAISDDKEFVNPACEFVEYLLTKHGN